MQNPFMRLPLYIALIFIPIHIISQTIVPGGEVYGTWTPDSSPYQVMGDITIPDYTTLAIEAGVTVEFFGHYALYVQGQLLALGSEYDTILFTVNDTTGFHHPDTTLGGWNGIKITDTPEHNDSTLISYCKLQYGKAIGNAWWLNAGGAVCVVNVSKVRISNCLISNNLAGGMESEIPAGGGIHLAWSDIMIARNTFSYNSAIVGGAIQIHESKPSFSNNVFTGNSSGEGGAISCEGEIGFSFSGDSFINNYSSQNGGGIMCWNTDTLKFNNVLFSGNKASWGGGIGVSGGTLLFDDCTFTTNTAQGIGGAIAADFCKLNISNSIFSHDSSYSLSGAIHNWHSQTVIDHCTFTENYASLGGAVYADFSSLEILQTEFFQNSADNGGAIRTWCSNLDIDYNLFENNHSYHQGGSIEFIADTNELSEKYTFNLENTLFLKNSADLRCGAIFLDQYNSDTSIVDIWISGCEFSQNYAERIGAIRLTGNISNAIIRNSIFKYNSSDLWTGCMTISGGSQGILYNCLFAYNSAGSGSGGALGSSNGGQVDVINCTFAGNSGTTGGGIGLRKNVTVNVVNSIFWGNNPKPFHLIALTDTTPCVLNLEYCDVQYGPDSIQVEDTVSIINYGEENISEQPLFVDILNGDYSLSSESPCIGTGIDSIEINGNSFICPELDLAGNPRPAPTGTMPDMGAIESPLPDTTGSVRSHLEDDETIRFRAYPNPFQSTLHLDLIITESTFVQVSLYSYSGEYIYDILHSAKAKGRKKIVSDLADLQQGVYILILRTNSRSHTQRIVKL